MTFSLIGRCEKTNMVGVAISSSSISVASRCPWVRAGVGAASTQNVTDPSLGNLMLDYLEKGLKVTEVIDKIIKQEKNIEYRQLLLIDNKGNTSQLSIGIEDFFPKPGDYSFMLKQCGLSPEQIAQSILSSL